MFRLKRKTKRFFRTTILPIITIAFLIPSLAYAGNSDFEEETGCITRRGTIYTTETGQEIHTTDGHYWLVEDVNIKDGKHVRVLFDHNGTPDPTDDIIVDIDRTLF